MSWEEHLRWLESLPKDKFYTARFFYERLGYTKYKRIWESAMKDSVGGL